jgi:hypothetical protein
MVAIVTKPFAFEGQWAWRLQTFDNTHDGWCFVCGLLWAGD